MDTNTFLDNFGHIADAPNGVQKLRELILQLAVYGRLSHKSDKDQQIEKLIQEAKSNKEKYEEDNKIRKSKPAPKIVESDIPFDIPEHWKWTSLDEIACYIQRGKGPEYVDESDTYVVSQKCIQWAGFELDKARYVDKKSLGSYGEERFLVPGDLLWNSTGTGTVGRVNVYPDDIELKAVADSHVTIIRLTNIEPRFLWCYIASPWVQPRIEPGHEDSLVSGTTKQVELNTSSVKALPVPVAPLEEQKRIVAKVDQLMALCDQLETQQKQKAQTRVAHNNAALDKLLTAQNPDEFDHHWQRIANNFHHLYDNLENLTKLRGSLLDLAVQGRLGTQKVGDTPASEIVAQTKATKKKLITEGKLRKTKEPLYPDYVPSIELPNNWEWSSLYELGEIGPRNQLDDNIEAAFIPMPLISEFYGVPVEYETRKWGEIKSGFTHFAEGDVALAKITPCYQNGKSCVMRNLKNGVGAGTTELHIFRPINNLVHPDYVLLYLKSPKFIEGGIPKMTGTAGQKRITRDYFAGNHFPLPPIEEQKRIVAKVDQLMALCDQLESKLKQSQTTSEKLVAATVNSLVAA